MESLDPEQATFHSKKNVHYDWNCLIWRSLACVFKASALWADAFYKSKYPSVCLFVRLSVCVFTFEVPFKRLFAPTSRSQMSNIFRDSESLGKSDGKKWSKIWTFLFENCLKSPRKKKFFFCADFALQNMVETTLPDGLETSGISLDVFESLRFGWFFPFFKKTGFWVFLVHPETTLPDGLDTSGRRAYR